MYLYLPRIFAVLAFAPRLRFFAHRAIDIYYCFFNESLASRCLHPSFIRLTLAAVEDIPPDGSETELRRRYEFFKSSGVNSSQL
jgi:hypothetical protein